MEEVPTDIPTHAPEAYHDFFGLPSRPLSIYHTGPAWRLPGVFPIRKEPRPVCIHEISPVWPELGEKIYKYFDSIQLKWTSIDPVRFAEVEEKPGPLFLWVGVLPGTLSPDQAKEPAVHCKEILLQYKITTVEIAFRESIYTWHTNNIWNTTPQLLDPVSFLNPTVDIRNPFTWALGLSIAPKDHPYCEGTGCLYLCEGGGSDRVFLLIPRHVALPPSKYPNKLYHRKDGHPFHRIIHLGSRAFQNALEKIKSSIEFGNWEFDRRAFERELARLGEHIEGEKSQITSERQRAKQMLARAEASKARVSEFYRHITSSWSLESERILGHLVYAPPISVGNGKSRFTEDWALVELNRKRINWDTFQGNIVPLGSELTGSYTLMTKLYPDEKIRAKFKYPSNGLMQLRDFVKYDELRHPTMLDADREKCLIVVKNGGATGVRLGRATGLESFVREYKDNAIHLTSMQIAVYAYSQKDRAFSAPGDSGSVVVDANSRIVGMIIGGAGNEKSTDVTYLSPYYFLDECIKKAFPDYHLFPICNPRTLD